MAIRTEHGRARPQRPRVKDLGEFSEPAPEPTQPRTANGRFAPGPAGGRARLPAALKRALASGAEDAGASEGETIYRDTLRQFKALLAELPANDSPQVQALVANQARALTLATYYATAAMVAGLTTVTGMRLTELASKLDARAERLAVTARDIAERINRARQKAEPAGDLAWLQGTGVPKP